MDVSHDPVAKTASHREDDSGRARRSLVMTGRVLLLLVAASGAVFAFTLGHRQNLALRDSSVLYVCPMHPEITASGPEQCAICRMALVEVAAAGGSTGPATPGPKISDSSFGSVKKEVVSREIQAPAWSNEDGIVVARIRNVDLHDLDVAARVSFFPTAARGTSIRLRPSDAETTPWDRSTAKVQFRIDDTGAVPRAGEVGWIRFNPSARELLVVPSSAILPSPAGPYVLAVSASRRGFSRRHVEVGPLSSGKTAILAGLREGDLIVTRHAFFFEAERRLDAERHRALGAKP